MTRLRVRGFGLALASAAAALALCAGCSTSTHPSSGRSSTGVQATANASGTAATSAVPASSMPAPPAGSSSATGPAPATGSAVAALARIPVKGRAPMTGYSRAQFGPAWTDDSDAPLAHNGCDTRNDVLARDLTAVVYRSGHCVVASGVLADPYSGTLIHYTRGAVTSTAVQIDHVVALGDAWQTGAQQLSAGQRVTYANDPGVLLAVDGPLNEQKGDADAASWLPPNKSYRCTYVARQLAIKDKYRLWMTAAEKDAIGRILLGCPTQPVPDIGVPVPATTAAAAPPAPTATAGATRSSAVPPAAGVYYSNCAAVRAAGKAPLYRGQPGYRSGLDRDGDGIACES